MSLTSLILAIILIGFQTTTKANALPKGYPDTERQKTSLNAGWKFKLGEPEADYYSASFDDSGWKTISVPHTLQLTSLNLDDCNDDKSQLTFHRNVGWYRKNIEVTPNENLKVFLEFEGAHQVTDVWINGKHVGQHSIGGYTPFHFDISDFVDYGKSNQLTLLVDNRRREDVPPDPGPFDYIKFSGLYRDVYMVTKNPVHITFNWEAFKAGVSITTPTVDPVNMNAVVNIETAVQNTTNQVQSCELVTRVIDANGFVVLKRSNTTEIGAGQEHIFNQIGGIEDDLHLWDINSPYLYRVNSMVVVDGQPVDVVENTLGIRKFEHDQETGFKLNNKTIELIGVNRHQHYAYVGDALPNSIHYKDVKQIKDLGFNIIRTAHYPHDDALIKACDELGILIYEEAPTWISIGNDAWFENLERAARVMVRNHRNHPSVVIWGAGINHRGYVAHIHCAVKQEDPTRLTASQSSRWTGWQTSGITDIFGNMCYGPVPGWTREEPMLAMEGRRGPAEIAKYKADPLLTGLISWTAHAYYTFHPSPDEDRVRGGMMTIFRQPKDDIEWYKSEMLDEPVLIINDQWKEGIEKLQIFSNCDEVELFANGKSFAKQTPDADSALQSLDHPPFTFNISNFVPGKLTAIGYNKGKEIITKSIQTPEKAYKIVIEADTADRSFIADGGDWIVAYANIVDRNGTLVKNAPFDVSFELIGEGEIIGNGTDIKANPFKAKDGIAPILIRSTENAGSITLTATAKGLKPGTATITTSDFNSDITSLGALPIYDMNSVRIDLGASDQLLQYEWTAWNGTDNEPSTTTFNCGKNSFKASLQSASNDGILRWLGEMNVMGKYGYAYGEGVLCIDENGLKLTLSGLPAGKYSLMTYHHAPHSNTDSMDPNRERLKELKIHTLPYAEELAINVSGSGNALNASVNVTSGKSIDKNGPGVATVEFLSNGSEPVTITFKDVNAEKGIWLNAFILSERP